MSVTVRRAQASDLDWLLSQLRVFAAQYGTAHSLFPEDPDHAKSILSSLIEHHLFLIAERGSEPLGFVAGLLSCHPFNPAIRTLVEQFWWVPEEHRGTSAGVRLLDAFVSHGEEHADWVVFTLEHHSPVNDRCLTRRGFRVHERSYLKEVG